jgi:hypothetical protein
MPIIITEQNQKYVLKLMKNYLCAECGAFLKLSHVGSDPAPAIICERFEAHDGIKPVSKNYADINLIRLLKGEPMTLNSTALQKMDQPTMLARVKKATWPKDLTEADHTIIATVCREYGLDPVFGELMIYQGRPYVTIDARRRKAQETDLLDGIKSRPATKEERDAWGIPEGDFFFHCDVFKKECSQSFDGWGRVRADETKPGSKNDPNAMYKPIQNDPMGMAEKRAEARALKRAFHIPLPSAEDIMPDGGTAPEVKKPVYNAEKKTEKPATNDHPTQAQITKLWATANGLGWPASDVNNLVKVRYRVDSVKDLTVSQMSKVIEDVETGKGLTADEQKDLK